MMSERIEQDRLHAYADGRLSADERADVAARLAGNPEQRADVAEWQRHNALLRDAYDPLLAEPIPPALAALARRAASPRRSWRVAAALGWIAVGAAIGSFGGLRWGEPPPADELATLPRRAAIAHAVFVPEVRHPVEVGAEQEAHLVAWLSKRLDTRLRIPGLLAEGFRLVGGRLIPSGSGPGALIMYEDGSGRRLTLYICIEDKDTATTAFRFAREDKLSTFYWVDGRTAYALSGELPRETLLPVATAIYRQLSGDPHPGSPP